MEKITHENLKINQEDKMKRPIEQLYHQLADCITQSIPDKWSEAWLCAEFEDDNGLTYGRYRRNDSSGILSFNVDDDLYEEMYFSFEQLRDQLKKASGEAWKRAKFTLKRDGSFNIDFEYENPSKWMD